MLDSALLLQLIDPLLMMTDPQKRVFWVYLLASGLLALWVLKREIRPIKPALKLLVSKKLWLNPSMLVDLKLILFNNTLWILLIAPYFGTQIALALSTKHVLQDSFGRGDFFTAGIYTSSLAYTLVLFVFDDFSRFFVHMLYHKIPLLWRFHAVHHSAKILTPLTLYRVHPIEMIINAFRSIFVAGVTGGVFIYLFDGKISAIQVLGISMFSLAFNLAGSNLRHSSIWLGWGKLEKWIMSPAQHQIHHSEKVEHFDKNYGVMIALWDRLFKSWVGSTNEKVESYGLGKGQNPDQTLTRHLMGL